MNKKHRFVLGFSIVGFLLVYLAFTSGIVSNQYEVSEAVAEKHNLTDKPIIVNGSMVIGTDKWDALNRTLTFKMTDGIATIDVIYKGEKPNIPPDYTDIQVIATGQFDSDVFRAYKMLTKCPSEYEGAEKVSK